MADQVVEDDRRDALRARLVEVDVVVEGRRVLGDQGLEIDALDLRLAAEAPERIVVGLVGPRQGRHGVVDLSAVRLALADPAHPEQAADLLGEIRAVDVGLGHQDEPDPVAAGERGAPPEVGGVRIERHAKVGQLVPDLGRLGAPLPPELVVAPPAVLDQLPVASHLERAPCASDQRRDRRARGRPQRVRPGIHVEGAREQRPSHLGIRRVHGLERVPFVETPVHVVGAHEHEDGVDLGDALQELLELDQVLGKATARLAGVSDPGALPSGRPAAELLLESGRPRLLLVEIEALRRAPPDGQDPRLVAGLQLVAAQAQTVHGEA